MADKYTKLRRQLRYFFIGFGVLIVAAYIIGEWLR